MFFVQERPYERFTVEECILRDHLAMDRTMLANERTYLAYLRTALAFFVTGVSFIQFFEEAVLVFLGWIAMPLGVAIVFVGSFRFHGMRKRLKLRATADLESADVSPPKAG